jgi:1,4-alpha-glucan branching enzyme
MCSYKVGCDLPGKYRVALDSDALVFGGHGRVGHDVDHFTSPEGMPGVPETNFNNRPNSFKVLSPPRTCVAYYRVDEDREELRRGGAVASGKIVTEYIDVEATSGETISGGWKGSEKDDCGKKGMKFVFRSSDEDCK